MPLERFWKRRGFGRGETSSSKRSLLSQGLPSSPTTSPQTGGQTDEEGAVIGLNFGVVSGAVTAELAAFGTAMDDDIAVAVLDVGLGADRLQFTAAGVGTVTGVDVNVERPEAKRAVVARGVAEREDLFSAVCTNKAAIVFCESFLFHVASEKQDVLYRLY